MTAHATPAMIRVMGTAVPPDPAPVPAPAAAPDRRLVLGPLVAVTLLDYVAQVPYYVHNDFTVSHPLPAFRAVGLLGLTLIWFLAGLRLYRSGDRWGYPLLLSYLVVEAVFYLETLLSGLFLTQLRNPSGLIDAVFVIGYLSGLTAAWYAWRLWSHHRTGARAGRRRLRP